MPIDRRRAGVWTASALLAVAVFVLVWGMLGEREPSLMANPDTDGAVSDIEGRIAQRLDEDVNWRPMRGAARVVAGRVRWADGSGAPWLEAQRVSGAVSLGSLGGDRVVVSDVRLVSPRARLVQAQSGVWNFQRALNGGNGGAGEGPSGGAPPLVIFTGARMEGGRVEVTTPTASYSAAAVNAVVDEARFGGPSSARSFVRLASLDARVSRPGGEAQPLAVRDGLIRLEGDRVAFTVDRLALGGSAVTDVEGVWSDALPAPGIRARGRATGIRFADLTDLIPRVPAEGTASFTWTVEPLGGRLAVAVDGLDLRSGESRVAGSLTLVLGGPGGFNLGATDLRLDPVQLSLLEELLGRDLPYAGTVAGSVTGSGETLRFDLDARLASDAGEPIVGRLEGTLSLAGDRPTLGRVVASFDELPLASLRALVPGLPLAGVLTGSVSFEGDPREGPLAIDATLRISEGTIALNGTLSLAGTPTYDLRGRLTDLRLQRLVTFEFPPVLLNGTFSLEGTGFEMATANARVDFDGRFSGWRAGPADIVSIDARLDDGTIAVDRGVMRLATATASASGSWRVVEPTGGSIAYDLDVESLEPFGPYLPGGSLGSTGSVLAEGTLSGTLERPHLVGTLNAADVRWGDWAAESGEAEYDVVVTDSLPRIRFDGTATGLITPTAGSYERAVATLTLVPPTFDLSLDADRLGGGEVQIMADGRMPPGAESEAVLRTVIVDLAEERWSLTSPATVRWEDGVVAVESLRVAQVEGTGLIALDGRVLPLSDASFTFDVRALPLDDVQRLLSRDPLASGRLWAAGSFEALGGTPSGNLEFRVEDAAARDLAFSELYGEARYDGSRLYVDALGALQDPGGTLAADVAIPLVLRVEDSTAVALGESGALEGTIDFRQVPLALAERFTDAVQDVEGLISGELELSGTAETPVIEGVLGVESGALFVDRLNQRYTDIDGRIVLRGQRATFENLSLRSDGLAAVSGSVLLEDLGDPELDLAVELERFRPMGVDGEEDVAVWGTVFVDGPLSAPVITGSDVRLNDGALTIPGGGPVDPFADEIADLEPAGDIELEGLPGGEAPAFGDFVIQGLDVEAGDDVWFVTEEVRARLQGELTIFHSGAATRIFGALEGDRGTFTLQAGALTRRFEIIDANIRFFGTPDLNPGLDVTAARTVGSSAGDPVELRVHVGGTLERPTLSLTTAEGTQIPESELLSFLVFGTPSFGAGQLVGEGLGLGTVTTFGSIFGISDILGAELQEAGLPVDYVQIRSAFVGNQEVFFISTGIELDNDVFLTAEAPLLSDLEAGYAFTIEWRIDREWTLEAGLKPVTRRQALGLGLSDVLRGTDSPTSQWIAEIRRRWTY
mgnify:CR=1 FL=1